MRILYILLALLCLTQQVFAGVKLEAVYPYNLDKSAAHVVHGGSTMPLFINITGFDVPHEQPAHLRVILPEGFKALANDKWRLGSADGRQTAEADWVLPADFGQSFDLLYIQPQTDLARGQKQLLVEVSGDGWHERRELSFSYEPAAAAVAIASQPGKKIDRSKFNWYIQSVTLPVDNLGNKDDHAAEGVVFIRDTTLEGFRNRMTGDGATNWSAVFNHPATFLVLDMRNPQRDVRLLKFKAELIDKKTGKVMPGLCTAGKNNEDSEHGWAGDTGSVNETTALISLDGKKTQAFIIPLYVDYFTVLEGDYSLRVTVSGNGQEKVQEVPLTIAKKHNLGLLAVGFSFICLLAVLAFSYKLKGCIYRIGARGAITVALFAALAFGGITLPTTLIGDLLHVFLGPFSGLVTGILSGMLLYLLVVALLVLFGRTDADVFCQIYAFRSDVRTFYAVRTFEHVCQRSDFGNAVVSFRLLPQAGAGQGLYAVHLPADGRGRCACHLRQHGADDVLLPSVLCRLVSGAVYAGQRPCVQQHRRLAGC